MKTLSRIRQPCQVPELTVRPAAPTDREAIDEVFLEAWGGFTVAGHGVLWDLRELPTLVAGDVAGVLTYQIEGDRMEVVSIDAIPPGLGVGSALLDAAAGVAAAA